MPYSFETKHIKLKPEQDKRRKLDEVDKNKIRSLYKAKEYSQRGLAKLFDVSRRLIQFTLKPETLEAHYKLYKEEKRHLRYYAKEKQRGYMKSHRQYKAKILKGGEIK